MVEHGQINLRVPDEAKEPLKDIAERIRKDVRFLARLKRFLQEDDGERSAFLMERLDRLEEAMAKLVAGQSVPGPLAPRAVARPQQNDMFSGSTPTDDEPGSPTDPIWAKGEGKGRRLTPEGKAEMQRRFATDETDAEIAAVLGVVPYSVTRARKAAATMS